MKTTNGLKEPLLKRIARHLSAPVRLLSRTRYDLIVPMGRACSCTQTLRRAGLQHLSFPFDWIALPRAAGPDVRCRADAICEGFHKNLVAEDFEPIETLPAHAHNRYQSRSTGFIYLHDFPKDVPFDAAFPKVREKYARRHDRLVRLIEESPRVLLVLLDRPGAQYATPDEDCRYAWRRMAERFPRTKFDFLHLSYAEGLPIWNLRERVADGFTDAAFDYRDYLPGRLPDAVDLNLAAHYFRDRFSVRDYRTPQEKARNPKGGR